MRYRFTVSLIAVTGVAGLVAGFLQGGTGTASQGPAPYQAPRTVYGDGKPDLNGIWQALNTANWDIEDHPMAPGPVWQLGALGGVPPGQGVVEGGAIPYQPWAAAKKKENFENRLVADVYRPEVGDPELKCYLPGVPRATYMPHPFQIVQTPRYILTTYTYASASRIIYMENRQEPPVDTWMGWSKGRWEGDTLVVEVTGLNGYSWLDRAGNFASDNLHVVERYTRIGPDHLEYEATIEDAKVFTRPWKIRMPLYRILSRNAQILDYRCVELSEEALYGRLRKQPRQ
jgi:hypothetical protein